MIIDGISQLIVWPEIHKHVSAFVGVHINIRDIGIERKLSEAKLNDGSKPVFIKNNLYVKSFYFFSNSIESKVYCFWCPLSGISGNSGFSLICRQIAN